MRFGQGRRATAALMMIAAVVVAACGGSPQARKPAPVQRAASPSASADAPADWPAYQGGTLQGVLPGPTSFGSATREPWQTPQLDGDVWGSPIVAGGLVIVATENNTVYAFPATGGASWQPTWTRPLGNPMQANVLQCGDVSPVSGITSTPVADVNAQRLYVVAFQRPGKHFLYTLDLRTGNVVGQGVAVDPPNDSPLFEQQRGALHLANGYVYVPFGGLDGDCGKYHGWIVGVPQGGGSQIQFRPPVCPNECAFWTPGGPTIGTGGGDLWVASGNSDEKTLTSTFDYGNAVMRLSPTLQLKDWFAPSNWRQLSAQDADLGSTRPLLLPDGLVFISGKSSTGYLLQQDHLGNTGGQLYAGQTCSTYAAPVANGDQIYLACWNPTEVMALTVNGQGSASPSTSSPPSVSFTSSWTRGVGMPGGLIEAFGAVWVLDSSSGQLEALDPATGQVRFSTNGGAVQHFATPAAADGHVFAVMGSHLLAVAAQG